MNLLYLINYFTFSTLLALFVLETGTALLSLYKYNSYKELIKGKFKYFWGVVGTFAVFYLVNLESTYPRLLFHIATIYEVPLLITAILILAKNTFAAYSEHFINEKKGKTFNEIYAAATVLSGIFVVGILTSAGSGIAVNLTANSLNLAKMIFNPFNIMAFIGLGMISIFVASGFLEKIKYKNQIWIMLIGYALLITSSLIYIPSAIPALIKNIWIAAIELSLIVISIIFYLRKSKYSGYIATGGLLGSVFLLGILQYPYTFGKGINMLNEITASGSETVAIAAVTAIGYALLIATLAILKSVSKKKIKSL